MKPKNNLIAIDGSIIETFNSMYSAQCFRSWYCKMCGEILEIKEVKNEEK